jgi:flagellar basal-body rod protein FlgB
VGGNFDLPPAEGAQGRERQVAQDIPLISMLEGKLRYVNQRQRLLSENIANADTPGFKPRDLKAFSFEAALRPRLGLAGLARTDPAHLEGRPTQTGAFDPKETLDSETRLDGNSVVLEEQMSKMTEARIDYEAAIDFYQQTNSMLSMAARAPGKSS